LSLRLNDRIWQPYRLRFIQAQHARWRSHHPRDLLGRSGGHYPTAFLAARGDVDDPTLNVTTRMSEN